MMKPFKSMLFVLLAVAFVSGCSRDTGPVIYPVTGTVTLDGEPLPYATILLKDPDGQQKTYVAEVINGEIKGNATAGKKTVEITATRPRGKMTQSPDGVGMAQEVEQYLPEKYNERSELTAEIVPGKSVSISFELKSK